MTKTSSKTWTGKTPALRKNFYNENRQIAKKLVAKFFPKVNQDQVIYKDIHNGYTNFSFLVTLGNGEQYQVRIPHDQNLINRKVEYDILFNYLKTKSFVYFDKETGLCIKKWLPGKNPKKRIYRSHKFVHSLFEKIKHIHSLPIKKDHNFKPIQFDTYNQNLYRLKFIHKKKFLCLTDRRSSDPLVLNHTDINPLNILYDSSNSSIKIIDFEWSGLASDYYDYANYIRETGLKYKDIDWSKYIENFDMSILEQYIFMCSVYAYLWTFAMPQTRKIIKYRIKTTKQIRKYYPAVINVDKSCYIEHDDDKK